MPYFMAVDPEFVRIMKRWILPVTDQQRTTNPTAAPTTSGIKPIQLDDDENDLR
jgi:hypothetical protein